MKGKDHICLEEKQKLCFLYSFIEQQLLKYVCIVGKALEI